MKKFKILKEKQKATWQLYIFSVFRIKLKINNFLFIFRYLKSHESHLANVALSNVESSRTIAQILFDMNDSTHR